MSSLLEELWLRQSLLTCPLKPKLWQYICFLGLDSLNVPMRDRVHLFGSLRAALILFDSTRRVKGHNFWPCLLVSSLIILTWGIRACLKSGFTYLITLSRCISSAPLTASLTAEKNKSWLLWERPVLFFQEDGCIQEMSGRNTTLIRSITYSTLEQ